MDLRRLLGVTFGLHQAPSQRSSSVRAIAVLRRRQEGRVEVSGECAGDLVAREPAGVIQLVGVDGQASPSASAWQPTISDDGKGQGWLAI